MISPKKKLFPFRIFLIWIVFSTLQLYSNVAITSAHSPHDVIDALELSPAFEKDHTLFIIISDHLRKSTNGGVSWKELVNGLDHRSLLSSISISHAFETDQTIFVSSDGDGIYRSKNGGNSWVSVNIGLNDLHIGRLEMSPMEDKQILLAAGSSEGLYKTTDAGDHWRKVIENLKVTAISYFPATGGKKILIGDSLGGLYISQDTGETWNLFAQNPEWGAINVIVFLSTANNDQLSIIIGTEKKGLIKTSEEGLSFISANKGLPDSANMKSVAISTTYEADTTLFATTWHEAVFRSTDGGDSWEKHEKGISKDSQADSDQYRSPHFRDLRISKSNDKNNTIFLAGFDGLFKSLNDGKDWLQLETMPVSQIKGLAISTGTENYSVAVTTYGAGAYISEDKGKYWFIANKGLKTTRLSDISFSSNYAEDKTIYSASMGFLLKSTDGGKNWQKISLSSKNWRHRIRAILIKLKVPGSLSNKILRKSDHRKKWPTIICLSPAFPNNQELFFATRYHGIFKSEDGGINISRMWDGMEKPITSLVVSPNLERDGTMFASIRGLGIYTTRDKGKTWYPSTSGLSFLSEWQKSDTIHQIFAKDIKLAISSSYATDKTLFAGSSEGLFKTTDGGMRWVHLHDSHLSKNDHIIGLGVSPNFASDRTLFVSIRGKGLLKSEDAGHSFRSIAPALLGDNHAIEFIEFSPNYTLDHTIYAASDEALFKSTNAGTNWKIIERPVRYENHREIFRYSGKWSIVKGDDYSASTISVSNDVSAEARLDFVSSAITLIGPEAPDLGIAEIFIDGKFLAVVDQFNQKQKAMKRLYSINGLSFAPHTIAIRVSDEKNPASKGKGVAIDAVEILR